MWIQAPSVGWKGTSAPEPIGPTCRRLPGGYIPQHSSDTSVTDEEEAMGELMTGKAGLVTGAASGIGRACAVRFAAEGAAVVVADLDSARRGGEQTVQTINDAGGRAEYFPCDVSRAEDNEALVAHVVARFGRLDFAHNNAGIGVHALLADTGDEDFDRVVAVNLRGTFLGMKHQIRQMQ